MALKGYIFSIRQFANTPGFVFEKLEYILELFVTL